MKKSVTVVLALLICTTAITYAKNKLNANQQDCCEKQEVCCEIEVSCCK